MADVDTSKIQVAQIYLKSVPMYQFTVLVHESANEVTLPVHGLGDVTFHRTEYWDGQGRQMFMTRADNEGFANG